jgi:hypothetical protein
MVAIALATSGCGLSDQNAFMPASLRQPSAPAPYEEPFPNVVALAKTQGRSLFLDKPDSVEISTPIYNSRDKTYAACARAMTRNPAGAVSRVTVLVEIAKSQFGLRRRAEPQDGCEGLDYETVTTE